MAIDRQTNGKRRHDLDFAGFAQEFLRRNPDYIQDYANSRRAIPAGRITDMQEVIARRWDVCFPMPA